MQSTNAADIELTSIKELNLIDAVNDSSSSPLAIDQGPEKKPEEEKEPDQPTSHHPHSDNNEQPSTSKLTEIMYRIMLGLIFIFVALAAEFLFDAAKQIRPSTLSTKLRLWWEVDLMELIFRMAIMTTVFQCSINAVGGALYKRIAVGWIIFCWATLLLVTLAVPESWTQLNNSTQVINVDRGGCHKLPGTEGVVLPKISDVCFEELSDNIFVQLTYNNSVVDDSDDPDIAQLAGALDQLKELGVGNGETSLFSSERISGAFDLEFHVGLLHPTCFTLFVDMICRDHFRKCRTVDCSTPPSTCLEDEQFSLVAKTIDCMKEQCSKDDSFKASGKCNTIDGASIASAITDRMIPRAIRYIKEVGIEDPGITYNFLRIAFYFEQESTLGTSSQENCNDWSIDSNSADASKSSSSTSVSTNITCDPNKNTFKLIESEQTFNSGILLACVLFSFTCISMTVGKNYKILKFRCTTVRTGCFLAAVLMAFLVYIGSTHLHDAAMNNSIKSSRDAQLVWRAVYLLVSFLCFSGGMVVLVPAPEAKNEVIVTNDNDTTAASDVEQQGPTTKTDSSSSSLCCSCCSCCNIFILKSVYALKAAKAQFWDGKDTDTFFSLLFSFLFRISSFFFASFFLFFQPRENFSGSSWLSWRCWKSLCRLIPWQHPLPTRRSTRFLSVHGSLQPILLCFH